jgi:uncharacterized protein (DUF302 family)
MYGFTIHLHVPFDSAVAQVTTALKEHGFGILSDIDFQATLKSQAEC